MDIISLVGRCLISCILLSILWKERDYITVWLLVPAMLVAGALVRGLCQKPPTSFHCLGQGLYAFSSCCCPAFRVAPVRVCGLTRRSRCGHVGQLQAVMLLVGFNARIAAIFQAVLLAMMDVRSAPLRPSLPPGCCRR